jgi:hypothetical protein
MLCHAPPVRHPSTILVNPTKYLSRVIGAVVAQLALLIRHRKTQDITFDIWSYYLAAQFVQSLSVITACVPYIKNLLLGVESGMFQTGHFELSTLRKDSRKPKERQGKGVTTKIPTRLEDHSNLLGSQDIPHPRTNHSYSENSATAELVTPQRVWDAES